MCASDSGYRSVLFDAQLSTVMSTAMKLPWETGVMQQIFDDSPILPQVLPIDPACAAVPPMAVGESGSRLAEQLVHETDAGNESSVPCFALAIKVRKEVDYFQELDHLWKLALSKWYKIFDMLGCPGPLGETIALGDNWDFVNDAIRDALGIKSPCTAVKRANTILRYLNWIQLQGQESAVWSRTQVILYLQSLESGKAIYSGGIALVEALKFSRFVMNIPIPDDLLTDAQIRGRSVRMASQAPEAKQARPLTVAEVARLERAMSSDIDTIDKYLVGSVLFAIFSRSRWSDLRYVDSLTIDKQIVNGEPFGFVESSTKYHKTATTLLKKQLKMPLVAPVLGVTHTDWGSEWEQAMTTLGIDISAVPFAAICKAPQEGGYIGVRSCTSEEIGDFVNRFLKCDTADKVSSHSFKHTTLSWCSAYAMDEGARTLLGHHELPGKPLATYSRDMLMRPLQLYASMLLNVRLGHFRPDQSRATRLLDLMSIPMEKPMKIGAERAEPSEAGERSLSAVPTTPVEVEAGEANAPKLDDEDLDSASSGSSSDSDSSPSAAPPPDSTCDIPGPVWLNVRSHVVHRCSIRPQMTQCGRKADTHSFELRLTGCSSVNARCGVCFKGEVISTREQMAARLDESMAKKARLQ